MNRNWILFVVVKLLVHCKNGSTLNRKKIWLKNKKALITPLEYINLYNEQVTLNLSNAPITYEANLARP